jgi:hypothetical protein
MPTMHGLSFDLRDALKTLRRDPAYASTVVLTRALTIGATTAVFSIVDGVLLRPLAYRESQRLVVVQEIVPGLTHLYPSLPANPRHFAAWRARSRSFEQLVELEGRPETLTGAGEPLFEVSAHDPIVIAATAVLTGAIGLAACVVAARQGLSLNLAAALREE